MIDCPIVDTHLHLWDPRRLRYPWLDAIPLLNRTYLLPEFSVARGQIDIDKLVFVQCECLPEQALAEAQWVDQLASREPRLQAIVAWAPLEGGERARPALEELVALPRVKGVRRIIQFESDPGFCLRPEFVRGVQMLAEHDLSFDLCISHAQLENTIALVRQCPQVRFVLDHIGKPDIAHRVLDPWRAQLKTLASLPNVWCKISGLVTEADHTRWSREDLAPYLAHVLDCFGFERVMFGGDWPVLLQASPYARWLETVQLSVASARRSEVSQLFYGNACEFYRLGCER
jgi:L-fuconolactonase